MDSGGIITYFIMLDANWLRSSYDFLLENEIKSASHQMVSFQYTNSEV